MRANMNLTRPRWAISQFLWVVCVILLLIQFQPCTSGTMTSNDCAVGTYSPSGSSACILAPNGTYVGFAHATVTVNCSSSLFEGAAICQSTSSYVSTAAGGASSSIGWADGLATNVYIGSVHGVAADLFGGVYFTDESACTIRYLNSSGYVQTVIGKAGLCWNQDGFGTNARLSDVMGVAVDSAQTVYFVDEYRIRKMVNGNVVSLYSGSSSFFGIAVSSSGIVYATLPRYIVKYQSGVGSNFVGNGDGGYADGTGSVVLIGLAIGITVSSLGIIFFVDETNHVIRKITPEGQTSLYAGTVGVSGMMDGPATSCKFSSPWAVTVATNGVIYAGGNGDQAVRMISTLGVVTTIAGATDAASGFINGFGTTAQFNVPLLFSVDTNGKLYVADNANHVVRQVDAAGYCPAGQYASSSNSVGCLDSPAGFYKPRVSFSDNYYICPAGKYSHAASSACSYCPYALAAGTTVCLYPTSQPSSQPSKQPSQPTGQPTSSPSQPSGQPTGAPSQPSGQPTQSPTVICLAGTYETLGSCHLAPAGTFVDFDSARSTQPCASSVFDGAARCQSTDAFVSTLVGGASSGVQGQDGLASNVFFSSVHGVALDSRGGLYITDQTDCIIRYLSSSGFVTTVVGSFGVCPPIPVDGIGTNAFVNNVIGIGVDSNQNVFFADYNYIRKLDPSWAVSTVYVGGDEFFGIAVCSCGVVYGAQMHSIIAVDSSGAGTNFAGNGMTGYEDGFGSNAVIGEALGIAISTALVLFFVDEAYNVIRKISPEAEVTWYAGVVGESGLIDGPVSVAKFHAPWGVAVDTIGVVYVGGNENNAIRMISTLGIVMTIAGSTSAVSGRTDGFGTNSVLNLPLLLAAGTDGKVYVADVGNGLVRLVDTAGYCPTGMYAQVANSLAYTCLLAPEGYYKPPVSLSDNYYICPVGTYSTMGATACTLCPYSTTYGSLSCIYPTSQPSGIPTSQPSPVPTSHPTAYCVAGTIRSNYQCTMASNGSFAATANSVSTATCTQSVHHGAAICQSTAGYVSTVAGGASSTVSGLDGMATTVYLPSPQALWVDTLGGILITDSTACTIRYLSVSGTITTVAGQYQSCSVGDGIGTNIRFAGPIALTADSIGRTYIADLDNVRIMSTSGVVTTLYNFGGANVWGLSVSSADHIYAATDTRIYSITTAGVASLLAGSAVTGYSEGTGALALFKDLRGMVLASNDTTIYVADQHNRVIRSVTTGGTTTLFAGSPQQFAWQDGPVTASKFMGPRVVVIDTAKVLYVVDNDGQMIRMISTLGIVSTISGSTTGTSGFIEGYGTFSQFSSPTLMAVSTDSKLYVTDTNNRVVRLIDLAGYCPKGQFAQPAGGNTCVVAPAGYYKPREAFSDIYYVCGRGYYSSAGSSTCSPCSTSTLYGATFCPPRPTSQPSGQPSLMPSSQPTTTPTGQPTTIPTSQPTVSPASWPTSQPSGRPTCPSSQPSALPTSQPTAYCVAGTFLASDKCDIAPNGTYTSTTSAASTLTCTASYHPGAAVCQSTTSYVTTGAGGASSSVGGLDGMATSVYFPSPYAVLMDSGGGLYIGDLASCTIRYLSVLGTITTVAGQYMSCTAADGMGTSAGFSGPRVFTVDTSGRMFIGDNSKIRIMSSTAGVVTTFYSGGSIMYGVAVAMTGIVYATDDVHVYSITTAGVSTSLAGSSSSGYAEGTGSQSRFHALRGMLLSSNSSTIYLCDQRNYVIRLMTTGGSTALFAGTPLQTKWQDGPATASKFMGPRSLVMDTAKLLYVVDGDGQMIRMISTLGIVTTIAGSTLGTSGFINGYGTSCRFNSPTLIAVSTDSMLYVTDQDNHVVRKIDLAGYCPAGEYTEPTNTTKCVNSPAGYYKPRDPFGNTYYVCSPGYYALAGASACTVCSTSNYYGATFCPRPTSQPSGQPTIQPTFQPTTTPTCRPTPIPSSQPSTKPTCMPNSHPTLQPSGQPTCIPTTIPTSQPTTTPSSQPNSNPTAWPSRQPTITPTNQPNSEPTAQPSCQPSSQPSSIPSSRPSRRPSARPSNPPSSVPSSQPTQQPTSNPTMQPSMQPSSIPSNLPSSNPTSILSAIPSSNPTVGPTSLPTNHPTTPMLSKVPVTTPTSAPVKPAPGKFGSPVPPSSTPSNCPTVQPSSQPSSSPSHVGTSSPVVQSTGNPTAIPSTKPSMSPSRSPSMIPSTGPSTVPTFTPTCVSTSTPTLMSAVPSGIPTRKPTVVPTPTNSLKNLWRQRLTNMQVEMSSFVSSSSITFADAHVNGSDVNQFSETCSSWNAFYSTYAVKSLTQQLTSLWLITTDTLTGNASNDDIFSCSDIDALSELQSFSSGADGPVTVGCNSLIWTVGACSNSMAVCVNCTEQQHSLLNAAYVLTPCMVKQNASCLAGNSQASKIAASALGRSFARIFIASFTPFPTSVIQQLRIHSDSTSLTIQAGLSSKGAVYCAAFAASYAVSSIQEIVSKNFLSWATPATQFKTNITVTGLEPITHYRVYCAVMSMDGTITNISTVISQRASATTKCCRIIKFELLTPSVFAGSRVPDVARLSVSSLPSTSLTLRINISSTASANASIFFPNELTLSSTSAAVSSVAFNAYPSVQIFNISVSLSGPASDEYVVHFTNGRLFSVVASSAAPRAPTLDSAVFNTDGSGIIVSFSAPTDHAGVTSGYFDCSTIVTGVKSGRCLWSTDSRSFTINLSPSFPVNIGDFVQMLPGVLRAACVAPASGMQCAQWTTVNVTAVKITAPTFLTIPTVLVAAPASIGICSDLVLDSGSSTGSGGRSWTNVNITVATKASNTTALRQFLYNNRFTNPLVVPQELLPKGYQYLFTVTLCNFLGACGEASAPVTIVNVALPYAAIVGPPVIVTLTSNSSLQLRSVAYVSECDGSTSSTNLRYSWTARQAFGNGSSVSVFVASLSKDSSKLVLAPFVLKPLHTYVIRLQVTSTLSLLTSSVAVTVVVPQSALIIGIAGGVGQRCVRNNEGFVVDASGSFDSGTLSTNFESILFRWSCYQSHPVYALSCPVSLHALNSSLLAGLALDVATNTTASLSVTMFDSLRSSTADLSVTVVSGSAPAVSIIASISTDVPTNQQLLLQGIVEYSGTCRAQWTTNDPSIDLTTISAVPPSRVLMGSGDSFVFNVFLLIYASSLPSASTLQFALSCSDPDLALSSFAAITVTSNSPPRPGSFQVSPSSGLAIVTSYFFTAAAWIDDELPLSYEFGFVSPSSGVGLVLQTKSLLTYATSALPAGLQSVGHVVQASCTVFDNIGTTTSEIFAVVVNTYPLNDTVISELTSTWLAHGVGSVDSLKQTISVVSSLVGQVNCTLSPNCTLLNRLECQGTVNTCGACVSDDYVGTVGDSNDMCVALSRISEFESQGSHDVHCSTDNDCSAWMSCNANGICVDVLKSCPSNCSFAGDCVFKFSDTKERMGTCYINNPQCNAVCSCDDGAFGADCSLTASVLQSKSDTILQLLDAVIQVNNLEILDSESVIFWASALQSLTFTPDLLEDAAISTVFNITSTLLRAISNGDITSTSVDSLAVVMDNCLSSLSGLTNESIDVLDKLSLAFSSQMVAGQLSQTVLQSSYRLIAGISSSGGENLTLTVPTTSLEDEVGISSSIVDAGSLAAGNTVTVVSLPTYWNFNTSINTAENYSSNVLRISTDWQQLNGPLRLAFAHYTEEAFGFTNSTIITVGTDCHVGPNSYNVSIECPYDVSVQVHCDGTSNHTILTRCPRQLRVPLCRSVAGSSLSSCVVVNASATKTMCDCTGSPSETMTRRLAGNEASVASEGSTLVALTTYEFTEFESVMISASQFNSLGALRSTVVIISTFGALWLGTIAFIVSMEYFQVIRTKPKKLVLMGTGNNSNPENGNNVAACRASAVAAAKPPDQGEGIPQQEYASLEECLRDYISELFSNAYSERPAAVRLLRELWTKHQYLAVFSKQFGYEQWVGAFELLSNLNASFFLLALFYDIQFPNDDGTCALHTTDVECESVKSMFNRGHSKCVWDTSLTPAACVWQSPHFSPYTTVVISVIVLTIAVPISYGLAFACEIILLAPSLTDVQQAFAAIRTRRASALSMLTLSDQQQRNKLNATSPTSTSSDHSTTKKKAAASSQGAATVFSSVNEMQSSMKLVTLRAHQLNSRSFGKQNANAEAEKAVVEINRQQYRNFDAFLRKLREYAAANRVMEKLHLMSIDNYLGSFITLWLPLLSNLDGDSDALNNSTRSSHQAAKAELESVVAEADAHVSRLKSLPNEQIGVQLLELFVRDCLGQHSREAIIFSQKVHPFENKYVMTWGIKCFTFCCIFILNLYFVFACMLYGREKGLKWQIAWLYTCIVNLFVDMFINSVTLAGIVHYFVPNLIVDQARSFRQTIIHLIHDMCTNSGKKRQKNEAFSASAYYFVSSHVARAFPDLLESRIVLGNSSLILSDEQKVKVNPSYIIPSPYRIQGRHSIGTKIMRILTVWMTTACLVFGSQSIPVQETIISMSNPGIVAVVALIGIALVHHSYVGIPIIFVMFLILMAAVYWLVQYYGKQQDTHYVPPVVPPVLPSHSGQPFSHSRGHPTRASIIHQPSTPNLEDDTEHRGLGAVTTHRPFMNNACLQSQWDDSSEQEDFDNEDDAIIGDAARVLEELIVTARCTTSRTSPDGDLYDMNIDRIIAAAAAGGAEDNNDEDDDENDDFDSFVDGGHVSSPTATRVRPLNLDTIQQQHQLAIITAPNLKSHNSKHNNNHGAIIFPPMSPSTPTLSHVWSCSSDGSEFSSFNLPVRYPASSMHQSGLGAGPVPVPVHHPAPQRTLAYAQGHGHGHGLPAAANALFDISDDENEDNEDTPPAEAADEGAGGKGGQSSFEEKEREEGQAEEQREHGLLQTPFSATKVEFDDSSIEYDQFE